MENPLRARMAERFAATGISPVAVAIKIGKGRDYIRDFLEGRKQSINFKLVSEIARELDCDPHYLTGEIGAPDGSSLRVSGMIETGVWRTGEAAPTTSIRIPADSRYAQETQKAFIVRGDSWKDAGIDDGSVVVTTSELPARDGDLVVITQEGDESTFETTIGAVKKRIIEVPGGRNIPFDDANIIGIVVMEMKVFG